MTRVGELGAGAGKFTRSLLQTGAQILSMEPVEGMRKKFRSVNSHVDIISGTAEQIPAQDQSFEIINAAQAAHWFDPDQEPIEIHRVLKTVGRLILIWNVRDETQAVFAELTRLMDPYEGSTPRYKSMNWKKGFERSGLFSPFEVAEFSYVQKSTVEIAVDRVGSVSFISALPKDERKKSFGPRA